MIRKICKWSTLGSIAIAGTLLIIGLVIQVFGGDILGNGTFWKVVGTFGVLFAIAIIGINLSEMLERKNIFAYISFFLMLVSAAILLVLIWNHDLITNSDIKVKACWSVVLTSFLFTLFINPLFKLGKRLFVLKLITWVFLGIAYIFAMLFANGIINGDDNSTILVLGMIVPAIAMVGLEIACSVIGRERKLKTFKEETKVEEEMITIEKSKYLELVNKVTELEAEIEKLKA